MFIRYTTYIGNLHNFEPPKIPGLQHWYTKSTLIGGVHHLEVCYRTDEEVLQKFKQWEEEAIAIKKKEQYEQFLFIRKYRIIQAIHDYFDDKKRVEERIEIEKQRVIRRKLRKENYKIKYGWRHTKNNA